MANKTIYLTEEGEEVFKKAKEMAGDSISSVITASLKKYVLNREAEEKGLAEVVLWVGTENYMIENGVVSGSRIKFVGKLLSKAKQEIGPEDHIVSYSLYLTRKGQFLLYCVEDERDGQYIESSYKRFSTFQDVRAAGLPGKLIFDAEMQLPDPGCEELDI